MDKVRKPSNSVHKIMFYTHFLVIVTSMKWTVKYYFHGMVLDSARKNTISNLHIFEAYNISRIYVK
jgi:hypothetical protein